MVDCFTMGNAESSPQSSFDQDDNKIQEDSAIASIAGSKLVPPSTNLLAGSMIETALQCGNLEDAGSPGGGIHGTGKKKSLAAKILSHAENCVMSPQNSRAEGDCDSILKSKSEDDANFFDEEYEELGRGRIKSVDKKPKQKKVQKPKPQPQQLETAPAQDNSSSALLAKSLMSEVGKPNAMSPNTMTQREKKLLKAQEKARQHNIKYGVNGLNVDAGNNSGVARPVGSPSVGVGKPSVMGTIAHAFNENFKDPIIGEKRNSDPSVLPPNTLSEHRASQEATGKGRSPAASRKAAGKHTVTIGLSLSRRSSSGHRDTVTRQTAFDFNELQDREYKYVSSTDTSGWLAGGGEKGEETSTEPEGLTTIGTGFTPGAVENPAKVATPDTVHIPIIQIDAESSEAVDSIIAALARGEIFIPHMAIIPEALSVNGVSPPDLVVRFGTERNEDLPPDEWPNWCLEFMHNQLYEYFHDMGARWEKRPFSITLARKVRWKTVKHMNKYFSHAERVVDAWRERGPQYLDPQLAYVGGGATPEEVARPHGIYLFRDGVPTNYFAPNFNPPYTTKMTRSLLFNVLGKSWDKKRREWVSNPIPKLITPSMLVSAMCGCTDNHASGFVATEATFVEGPVDRSTILPDDHAIRSMTPKTPKRMPFDPMSPLSSTKNKKKTALKFDKDNKPIIISSAQASPSKTKFDVSSPAESFEDGTIPAPSAEMQESKKVDSRDPEPINVEPAETTRQALEPVEKTQENRQEQQAEGDVNPANDENSGDSKNHFLKKNEDKLKKKQETQLSTDEEWLNDMVSFKK